MKSQIIEVGQMYKVLLVDDESIERQGLRKILINHYQALLEIIEAETGREAIEKASIEKPDIVFMDMKMPGMDGIEAIEAIQKISPQSQFVIVSAYDSFQYAQKAINIQVSDYLLKPVKRTQIIGVFDKFIELKSREMLKEREELALKAKLNELIPFIENELIQSIMLHDIYRKEMIQNLDLLKFSGENCFAIIIVLNREDLDEIENPIQKNIIKQNIEDYIKLNLKESFACLVGRLTNREISAVIENSKYENIVDYRANLIEWFRSLREKIKIKFGLRSKIGIGSLYASTEDLYRSFKEAMIAVQYKSIEAKVIHFQDINIGNTYGDLYPIELEKELITKIQMGALEEIRIVYNHLMDWIFNTDTDNNLKKLYLLELRAVLNRTLGELLGDEYLPFSTEKDVFYAEESELLFQIRKMLFIQIEEAVYKINLKREAQLDSVINEAIRYIEVHYSKDITLEEVAQRMNFSPYYFSKMFKKQTGINFIDFLTSVRLENAKILIQESDLSIKEVANRVGYRDPNYFSRVFKKNMGVNPSEYK